MAYKATKNLTVKFIADTSKWDKSIKKIKTDMALVGKLGGKGGGKFTPAGIGGGGGRIPGIPSAGAGGFGNAEAMSLLKGDLAGTLTSIAGKFAVATAAAYGFYQGMSKVISIGNETRTAIVQFSTLLGSEEKAMQLFKEVKQFGATTPLELPEISTATKQLLAVKVEAKDVVKTLQMLGDVSQVSGKNFNELASIYAKNKSSNFIQGEDLNQLIEAGIPILDEFSKMFGKSAIEVKKMGSQNLITFAHLEQAFKSMTSEGGLYFQGMSKMSKEVPGIWSNIKDTWNDIFRAMSGADLASSQTSFWSYLRDTLADFSDRFTAFVNYVRPALVDFGTMIGSTFGAIWDVVIAIWDLVKTFLIPALLITYNFFRGIIIVITKTMQLISFIARGISSIVNMTYTVIDNLFGISEKFKNTIEWINNLYVKIVTVIVTAGIAISVMFESMLTNIDEIGKRIYKSIIGGIMEAWNYIKNSEIYKFISGKVAEAGKLKESAIQKVTETASIYNQVATEPSTGIVSNNNISNTRNNNSTVNNHYNIKLSKEEKSSVFEIFNQSGRPKYSGAF